MAGLPEAAPVVGTARYDELSAGTGAFASLTGPVVVPAATRRSIAR